jgi:hypothetical protein
MCKLAVELHKSYTEIENLPLREINLWKEYFGSRPFSEEREDLRTALVCSVIANFAGKSAKKEMKVNDFLLKFGTTLADDRESFVSMKNKVKMWMMAHQAQQNSKKE